MQRSPGFGKMTGIGSRRAGSGLGSADSAFESIANILDVPTTPVADNSPRLAEILSSLDRIGDIVSIKQLAESVPLSNQELAETLAKAGEDGRLSFSQSDDGTTFVQRTKTF